MEMTKKDIYGAFIERIDDERRQKDFWYLQDTLKKIACKLGIKCKIDDPLKITFGKERFFYSWCACRRLEDDVFKHGYWPQGNRMTDEEVRFTKKFIEQHSDEQLVLMSNGVLYRKTDRVSYAYVASVESLWKDQEGIIHTADRVVPCGLPEDYEELVCHGLPRYIDELVVSYTVDGEEYYRHIPTGVYVDPDKSDYIINSHIIVDKEITL